MKIKFLKFISVFLYILANCLFFGVAYSTPSEEASFHIYIMIACIVNNLVIGVSYAIDDFVEKLEDE